MPIPQTPQTLIFFVYSLTKFTTYHVPIHQLIHTHKHIHPQPQSPIHFNHAKHPNPTSTMGLLDGLQHLIASFFEILSGIFNTILSAFQSVFNLFQSLLSSVFDLMSSAVGFVLGNSLPLPYLIHIPSIQEKTED